MYARLRIRAVAELETWKPIACAQRVCPLDLRHREEPGSKIYIPAEQATSARVGEREKTGCADRCLEFGRALCEDAIVKPATVEHDVHACGIGPSIKTKTDDAIEKRRQSPGIGYRADNNIVEVDQYGDVAGVRLSVSRVQTPQRSRVDSGT